MNVADKFPNFGEFEDLVNVSMPEEDLDFHNRIAIKVGFKDWHDYLYFVHEVLLNSFNIAEMINSISEKLYESKLLSTSINSLVKNNSNEILNARINQIEIEVKKLPQETYVKILQFEKKLCLMFFTQVAEKNSEERETLEFIVAFLKDFHGQSNYKDQKNIGILEEIIEVFEAFLYKNSNSFINKFSELNYYFPNKSHHLEKLYCELLERNFILPNDDFLKTFKSKVKPSNLKSTVWLVEDTKLFYLMYRLNNNKDLYLGEKLDRIIDMLFSFNVNKTKSSFRSNFLKAVERFKDTDYKTKKMSEIDEIIEIVIAK